MYEDYFGLDRPPFKITPDTSLFYEGGKRGDILAALVYAIHRGEGIIKVVGEVGSGKTMLCRMLQLKLPDTVEIVYIANPSVSPEDILFVIAHELSLKVNKGDSKHVVMHLLQDYLLRRHMENKQVVLFIEEAQGMPLETLEEIRLLSNLETDEHKLLQIILFGQPELDQNLAQQSIRQLRERITHNFTLEPLDHNEIHSYLNFRMREVGYTGPELINKTVAKKVEQHSGGLLRRVNIIADKILLSAYAEGTHNLSPKHVTQAVNDSEFSQEVQHKSRALWWLGLLVVVALAFALYQTRGQWLAVIAPEMAPKSQNTAINDKAFTDMQRQPAETVPLETGPAAILGVARAAVGDETGAAAARARDAAGDTSVAAVKATVPAAEPKVARSAADGDTRVEPAAAQSAPAAEEQIEPLAMQSAPAQKKQVDQVVQQVEQVVSQVEAAVLKAEAAITRTDAASGRMAVDARREPAEVAAAAPQVPTQLPGDSLPGVADTAQGDDYVAWLQAKLKQSRDWLSGADRNKVSIQVLMRRKSAARELVQYLRTEWPLDLSKTYLYEVNIDDRSIYRVFYSEYDSLTDGKHQLELLPESVKVNSPYLHSVSRMQKALL